MASHHHCHHSPPPNPTPSCYCHQCYALYSPFHHHAPPPPDPHLHYHHPPAQPHLYYAEPHLPNSHQYHPRFEERYLQEERQTTNATVSSLLRRIAALESALRRRTSSHSLRDAAARTIQTHFRAFLSRRSRTLRQLKDLASIKSALNVLKSSVSEKTHFGCGVTHRNAVDLLLKLAAIEGCDPLIRDGKSSLTRELNRFLDYIDVFCMERRGLPSGVNVRYCNVKPRASNSEREVRNETCSMKRVNEEKLRGLVEKVDKLAVELDDEESELIDSPTIKIHGVPGNRKGGLMKQHGGIQSKVKKSVSFAENGKVYRFLRSNHEPFSDEDCDDSIDRDNIIDVGERKDDFFREVKEIEEEIGVEGGEFQHGSDGKKDLRTYLRGRK